MEDFQVKLLRVLWKIWIAWKNICSTNLQKVTLLNLWNVFDFIFIYETGNTKNWFYSGKNVFAYVTQCTTHRTCDSLFEDGM